MNSTQALLQERLNLVADMQVAMRDYPSLAKDPSLIGARQRSLDIVTLQLATLRSC